MSAKYGEVQIRIYFSELFGIAAKVLEDYGALDVSLVNDLPFFVDPFLLFNSEDATYQDLHERVIRYLAFLREESASGDLSDDLIWDWFTFKEISQNWLGFSRQGNKGRGLGWEFAQALHSNLKTIFHSFGSEQISCGTHLEKLCLIKSGVGKDHVSDFATNLIKDYLCEYTQEFARQHLHSSQIRRCAVKKAAFNYKTKMWAVKNYDLPFINGDFVILTPRNLLTKDESWISRSELIGKFTDIVEAVPNGVLRTQLSRYLSERLDRDATKKKKEEIFSKAIETYPEIIEYYIRSKEDKGDEAADISDEKIAEALKLFVMQVKKFADLLYKESDFYETKIDSLAAARTRVNYMKKVIEDKDGYRIFYIDGIPVKREEDLQILYRLTWFASVWDVNREPNNGRGPADYTVSQGAKDKSIVEMKLASNKKLKQNLKKQVGVYEAANDTKKSIKVILYFSQAEKDKVRRVLRELKLAGDKNIIMIDASRETKTSASNVR